MRFHEYGKRGYIPQTSCICVIHLNVGNEVYCKCYMLSGLNPFTFWSSVAVPLLAASSVPTKRQITEDLSTERGVPD